MSRGTGQSEHWANTRTGVAAGRPNEPPEYAPRPRPGVLVTSTVFPVRLQPRSTYIRALHSPALIDDEDSRSRAEVGKGTDVVPCPWPSLGAFLPIKCTAQAQKYHVQNSKISLTRFA